MAAALRAGAFLAAALRAGAFLAARLRAGAFLAAALRAGAFFAAALRAGAFFAAAFFAGAFLATRLAGAFFAARLAGAFLAALRAVVFFATATVPPVGRSLPPGRAVRDNHDRFAGIFATSPHFHAWVCRVTSITFERARQTTTSLHVTHVAVVRCPNLRDCACFARRRHQWMRRTATWPGRRRRQAPPR